MDTTEVAALPSSTALVGTSFAATATVLCTKASESTVQADSLAKRRRSADAWEENPDSFILSQKNRKVCTGAPMSV